MDRLGGGRLEGHSWDLIKICQAEHWFDSSLGLEIEKPGWRPWQTTSVKCQEMYLHAAKFLPYKAAISGLQNSYGPLEFTLSNYLRSKTFPVLISSPDVTVSTLPALPSPPPPPLTQQQPANRPLSLLPLPPSETGRFPLPIFQQIINWCFAFALNVANPRGLRVCG